MPLLIDPDDFEHGDVEVEPISIRLTEVDHSDGVTAGQLYNFMWLEANAWWRKLRRPRRWWRAVRSAEGWEKY